MIFYTLGTQLSFERMTRAVDDWAGQRGRSDVFGQISDPGADGYRPRNFEWVDRIAPAKFDERFTRADFIIAHAGMGSIITAQDQNKLIVVMPRRAHLGERCGCAAPAISRRMASIRPGSA